MSIQDFHSSLAFGNERNVLFAALRKLQRLDPLKIAMAEGDEELYGWIPWSGEPAPNPGGEHA